MLKPMAPMTGFPPSTFGRPLKGAAALDDQFRRDQAGKEGQGATDEILRFIRSLAEVDIVTADGKTLTVLSPRPGGSDDAATGTRAPWEVVKVDGMVVRIYPSAIWDGLGHDIWPTFQGVQSVAESSFDIQLPSPNPSHGYIWVECTVVDTDDYHGILTGAVIKYGAAVPFYSKVGSVVNIPICGYFVAVGGQTVTIDPIRAFVFTLRRFGPPGSATWDTTPT